MSVYTSISGSSPGNRIDITKSTTANISLIAGILGLTILPFLGSVIAILTGSFATKEIEESGGSLGGEGLAQAGKILGWIGVGLTVLSVCLAGVFVAFSICLVTLGVSDSWSAIIPIEIALI